MSADLPTFFNALWHEIAQNVIVLYIKALYHLDDLLLYNIDSEEQYRRQKTDVQWFYNVKF